jgi:uncharacterized protein
MRGRAGALWHGPNGRRCMRGGEHAFFGAALIAVLTCCAATLAMADNLYRAQTAVTGQGEENRRAGFAVCLEDVLIKVSGAMRLAGDSRLEPYKSTAQDLVRTYSYRDQKLGKPKNDEQGTRDRPYDLTVDFDEKRVDAILLALGVKPWLARRPMLGVFVEMEQGTRKYVVTSDAARTDLQRAALLAAADKRGMPIVLPDVATAEKLGSETAAAVPSPAVVAAMSERGGEATLFGHLVWDDQELMWRAGWQLDWQGRSHQWQSGAVTFDEAFRRGIGEAAETLSGSR